MLLSRPAVLCGRVLHPSSRYFVAVLKNNSSYVRTVNTSHSTKMNLKEVVSQLESFAPTSLAESWDNVGLLIEPSEEKTVKTVFLTNDLTEPVLEEALQSNTDLIISYHPPLFRPFKRLTSKTWKERVAVKLVEEKVALYSPHTSWDCVPGGINSWLVSPYGQGKADPVTMSTSMLYPGGVSHTVSLTGLVVSTEELQPLLAMQGISVSIDTTAITISCTQAEIPAILSSLPAR